MADARDAGTILSGAPVAAGPLPVLEEIGTEARALLATRLGDAPLPLAAALARLMAVLRQDGPSPYYQVSEALSAAWRAEVEEGCPPTELGAALLLALLAEMPQQMVQFRVPASVQGECVKEFRRILRQLGPKGGAGGTRHCELGQDQFLKELALCRLVAFPCVAAILDVAEYAGRAALKGARLADWPRLAGLLVETTGRFGPFLGIHLYRPLIGGFRPAGWHAAYALGADLLRARPQVRGIMGAGWFYDPALKDVSPELAYLHDDLAASGAIFLNRGSTPDDIANATAAPGPRRALMAEGKYQPTGYVMLWPRRAVLAWDARRRAGEAK